MAKSVSLVVRIAAAAGLAACLSFVISPGLVDAPGSTTRLNVPTADPDARLQASAIAALGKREGAIVIIDPQTGRVRAIVNSGLAFEQAFPPGSTIKPFTTLAALRAGVITKNTRMLCRGTYKREEVVDSCSHRPNLAPFDPSEALAYSCNYYFAKVGERLDEDKFASLLAEFGFGQRTGINLCGESAGVLARGRVQPQSAVGEGEFLQVTPLQLGMAYAALFNGGRLFSAAHLSSAGFVPRLRAQLRIDDAERSVLLTGMRGALTFGTAAGADLDSLPAYVVGKTGTATPLQGFRTHGWFVGLVFAPNADPSPANAQLVVVVYLKNARGADAAEVAKPILAEFLGDGVTSSEATYVKVHQVAKNVTRTMSLEDYVLHVAASEGSVEDEPEALKALAIAARTYALKNVGRHRADGYDFCSTTHCQRFESASPRPALAAAIKETAGLVLRDDHDQIADAYFSASCGGMTANLNSLWGGEAPQYLRGVCDSYCNSGAHYRWVDAISSERLATALRSDSRTDVGPKLRELSVTKYDQTGRAEVISIAGEQTRQVSGWDFKLIVGRALGWNVLKSSRFTILRSGSLFVFRGGGFGHGLGLCQEGSHVMAQRGQSFVQILAHYFPGTTVGEYRSKLLTHRSSHFRLVYPQTLDRREVENVLGLLESNRTELLQRVSSAGIEARLPDLEIVVNETTEGRMLEHYGPQSLTQSETDMRTAYAAAYKHVRELIRLKGESKVWTGLQDVQDLQD
jgi:SpoIID/LytB domain protein